MQTVLIDGIPYDLNGIEKDIWHRLTNGSLRYKDAFHNPVVANMGEHGVTMRTVVLRKVFAAEKQLCLHTDIRSGKWAQLQQNNVVSWLFYDAAAKLQLRLSGSSTLHHNDKIADDAWANSTMSSRKIYMGQMGPSSISEIPTNGLPVQFETTDPTAAESESGRKNFGVVITTVNWMEWLWLNSKGHRRASFVYDDQRNFEKKWLIP